MFVCVFTCVNEVAEFLCFSTRSDSAVQQYCYHPQYCPQFILISAAALIIISTTAVFCQFCRHDPYQHCFVSIAATILIDTDATILGGTTPGASATLTL